MVQVGLKYWDMWLIMRFMPFQNDHRDRRSPPLTPPRPPVALSGHSQAHTRRRRSSSPSDIIPGEMDLWWLIPAVHKTETINSSIAHRVRKTLVECVYNVFEGCPFIKLFPCTQIRHWVSWLHRCSYNLYFLHGYQFHVININWPFTYTKSNLL